MSDYKVYKNLHKPGYIDHRVGIGSDCRYSALFWQRVIEFSPWQSVLIMMPFNQLSSDDLKNIKQVLMMHNSLNILLVIKHLPLDLGMGELLLKRISRIGVTKGGRAQ